MYRVAFDPDLPVQAAQPFTAAGRTFASGEPVDWRALGVTEQTLYEWWLALLVVHPLPSETTIEMPGVADAKLADALTAREACQHRSRKRKQPSADDLSDAELERLTRPE